MRTRDITTILVSTTMGLGGGYLLFRPSQSPSRELRQQAEQLEDIQRQLAELAQSRPIAPGQPAAIPAQASLTEAAVEQIVRKVAVEREQAAKPEPPPPTVQNIEAYDHGSRLLADALAAKRWTQQDDTQMNKLVRQMADGQLLELTRQFIVATNSRRIQVETAELPVLLSGFTPPS